MDLKLPIVDSKRGELPCGFEEMDKLFDVCDGAFKATEGREPAKSDAGEFSEDEGM